MTAISPLPPTTGSVEWLSHEPSTRLHPAGLSVRSWPEERSHPPFYPVRSPPCPRLPSHPVLQASCREGLLCCVAAPWTWTLRLQRTCDRGPGLTISVGPSRGLAGTFSSCARCSTPRVTEPHTYQWQPVHQHKHKYFSKTLCRFEILKCFSGSRSRYIVDWMKFPLYAGCTNSRKGRETHGGLIAVSFPANICSLRMRFSLTIASSATTLPLQVADHQRNPLSATSSHTIRGRQRGRPQRPGRDKSVSLVLPQCWSRQAPAAHLIGVHSHIAAIEFNGRGGKQSDYYCQSLPFAAKPATQCQAV